MIRVADIRFMMMSGNFLFFAWYQNKGETRCLKLTNVRGDNELSHSHSLFTRNHERPGYSSSSATSEILDQRNKRVRPKKHLQTRHVDRLPRVSVDYRGIF
jgi:hypothetical protein